MSDVRPKIRFKKTKNLHWNDNTAVPVREPDVVYPH
jgi:hypothetical protein